MVLPYKFVAFRLVGWIEEAVIDVPTTVLETTLLPDMVENTTTPLIIEEPIIDERITVLPLSVEKARDVNPLSVDPVSVDTFIVLPLSVDTVNRFAFIVDVITLDTIIISPVRVEYTMEPLYKLEMSAVETRRELPVMVEKTPAFA
jgi:hypothetical protein